MSDLSPGLIAQIIARLRAIAGPSSPSPTPPVDAQGRPLPMSNMSEVDRMAAGLPPVQRY